jgi:hypothetical protein
MPLYDMTITHISSICRWAMLKDAAHSKKYGVASPAVLITYGWAK